MKSPNIKVALDILDQADDSFTARAYTQALAQRLNISPRKARQELRALVETRELSYQDLYGSTRITKSFLKPVAISPHFILAPPDTPVEPKAFSIRISQGISFGSGQHPTTQLCMEALDRFFFKTPSPEKFHPLAGADVGTGSGVLAMAMCRGGLGRCRAWEIDPNAAHEARRNIALNNLSHRIQLHEEFMPEARDEFSLICANLRYPTLRELAPLFRTNATSQGTLILSGIREWETQDLVDHYENAGFICQEIRHRKKWGAVVFQGKK